MDDIGIGVLGPTTVTVGDRTVEIRSPTQRALLLRLAIDVGRPVPVDAIADALWGEDLPKDPANAVRYHVWQLRAAMGSEVIATGSGSYTLTIDPDRIDAERFERLAAGASSVSDPGSALAALDEALRQWRGAPFTDAGSAEFAQPTIRRLEEAHRVARELRARVLVDLDRTSEAIPELEGLLEQYPHSEASWSTLMTALYRSGRQADALRAYQRARTVLGDDLGIEPTPELRSLEEQVLLHDRALDAPRRPTTNLPNPLTSFVGRDDEIAEVCDTIAQRRILTIVGVGGAGKTRLALEAGRAAAGGFPDGVWLVDLTGRRPGDDLFETIARVFALTGSEHATTDRNEVLAFLSRRTCLLILDNCEQVLEEAADTVTAILERCPTVRVLATSRAPLHLAGEAVFAIPALGAPQPHATWEAVSTSDSGHLFVSRARDAGAPITGSDEDALAIGRICAAVAGIPLAIELAAARARTVGVTDLAADLAGTLGSYGELRGTSERHRTMTSVIRWSYDLLDDVEQRVFRSLGVFVGGFTMDAAAHVCSGPDLSADDVLSVVDRLVDQSVVHRDGGRTARHRLLEPFRLFALEELAAEGELDRIRRRHAEAFAAIVIGSTEHQRGPKRNEVYAGLASEADNIRAALEFFEEASEGGSLCSMVAALARFWIRTSRLEEQRRWGEACLPYLDEHPNPVEVGYLCTMLAYAAPAGVEGVDPPGQMARALRLGRESGDELAYADFVVLFLNKTDALAFGELQGAPGTDERLAREARRIFREHGDHWGEVDALTSLCVALLWDDQVPMDEVMAIAAEARDIALANGDVDGAVWAQANEIAARMRDPVHRTNAAAITEMYDEMLSRAERSLSTEPLADGLSQYAWFRFGQGDVEAAIALERRVADLADDAGMLYLSVLGHTSLAFMLISIDLDAAAAEAVTALERAGARGVDRQTVWVVEVAARILVLRGRAEDAARLLGAAESHRSQERQQLPVWEVERYAETAALIESVVGARWDDLRDEGRSWSIPTAADRARTGLLRD